MSTFKHMNPNQNYIKNLTSYSASSIIVSEVIPLNEMPLFFKVKVLLVVLSAYHKNTEKHSS